MQDGGGWEEEEGLHDISTSECSLVSVPSRLSSSSHWPMKDNNKIKDAEMPK